jgi:hypothetical protein
MVFRLTKFSFSVSITETLLARGHWDWEMCDAETLDTNSIERNAAVQRLPSAINCTLQVLRRKTLVLWRPNTKVRHHLITQKIPPSELILILFAPSQSTSSWSTPRLKTVSFIQILTKVRTTSNRGRRNGRSVAPNEYRINPNPSSPVRRTEHFLGSMPNNLRGCYRIV